MNVFELEKEKSSLLENLEKTNSFRQKVILYNRFFGLLLSNDNKVFAEAYIAELLNDYLSYLKKFEPFYIHPKFTFEIINRAKIIADLKAFETFRQEIYLVIEALEQKLKLLNQFLNGESNNVSNKTIFFPLLEEEEYPNNFTLGIIESLTVKISVSAALTNFIIIPSEKFLEERLQSQIENSWKNALNFVKDYTKKINQHHEVIISFDRRAGIYQGDSLGIALTLGFIEELLHLYNSPTMVQIKGGIAFTGGINRDGKVINTSKNIIEKKAENVFFSELTTFVVPRSEENFARSKADELNKEFPNKKLDIIGVENLNDILNRRNLVDIHKQKLIARSANYTKKHSISIILVIIILTMGLLYTYTEVDSNPSILFNSGNVLYVQNKLGKTLWSKRVLFSSNDEMLEDLFL